MICHNDFAPYNLAATAPPDHAQLYRTDAAALNLQMFGLRPNNSRLDD